MKKMMQHLFMLIACTFTLSACSAFFDKDNTPPPNPLVSFKQELNVKPLWYTSTGSGVGKNYLKLAPSIQGPWIFTASHNGTVAANDKISGKSIWYTRVRSAGITGGVHASGNAVYVSTSDGETIALNQANGNTLWKATTTSEILAPAAGSQGIAVVKSIDDHIVGYSAYDGHVLWNYHETEPSLMLRGSSAPQISRDSVLVGFENGNLAKLNLHSGRQQWNVAIAEPQGIFAIQRMIDMDADPIIVGNRVYAATYQGRIAAVNLASGGEIWSHDISSFSGLASDGNKVFVSDARSHIWAFNASNGADAWQQNSLYARTITGPAVIGDYVVVGDAEGYLHWMSKQDGHFVARTYVNSSGILATPIVDNNILYVYTNDGHLAAYSVL